MRLEFARYPKYEKLYLKTFEKMLEMRKAKGKRDKLWKTPEDVMNWWLDDKGQRKVDEDQLSFFQDDDRSDYA